MLVQERFWQSVLLRCYSRSESQFLNRGEKPVLLPGVKSILGNLKQLCGQKHLRTNVASVTLEKHSSQLNKLLTFFNQRAFRNLYLWQIKKKKATKQTHVFGFQIHYAFASARDSSEMGIQHLKQLCRLESSHLNTIRSVNMFSKSVNMASTSATTHTGQEKAFALSYWPQAPGVD